jgi:pimeloyl-ACP methyl ester carboxylesterase
MRGRWLERPWGRMRVWEAGRGESLLALHGLGGSGRYWARLADQVGDRYRVLAPDLAGFGGSDKPPIAYDRPLHLGDLDALMRDVGPSAVVGHSLGGVLGALWAAGHVAAVRGLAMAAAPFPAGEQAWRPPDRLADGRVLPKVIDGTLRVAWPIVSAPIAAARRYPRAVVRDFGRQTVHSRVGTLFSLWSDPSLAGDVAASAPALAGLPVLLLHAEDDRRVGVGNVGAWASLLPRATLLRLPSGGHQFLLTSGFAPLEPWLRSLSAA